MRPEWLERCPTCRAEVGKPCTDLLGYAQVQAHTQRVARLQERARREVKERSEPLPGPSATAPDREASRARIEAIKHYLATRPPSPWRGRPNHNARGGDHVG